jgi:hypothetical protein
LRVFFQIQPTRLKTTRDEWKMRKKMSRKAYSRLLYNGVTVMTDMYTESTQGHPSTRRYPTPPVKITVISKPKA